MKETYTINWGLLINKYNSKNIGQLSQKRLAEVFNTTGATISYDMTLKRKLETVNKYKEIYSKYFEEYIPFEELLIKYKSKLWN